MKTFPINTKPCDTDDEYLHIPGGGNDVKVQGLNHNVYTEKKKRLNLLSWSKESQQDV